MSMLQQVVLRYRGSGHVRFELPALLCQPFAVDQLMAGLSAAVGVYRVDLYPRQRKLSIRYSESATNLQGLAKAMQASISAIEAAPRAAAGGSTVALARKGTVSGWLGARYQALGKSAAALGTGFRNATGSRFNLTPGNRKFANEFLTDVLVLYLIKRHWELITQHWLKRPWQFRYEWMAAVYMVFLLVKSKKS